MRTGCDADKVLSDLLWESELGWVVRLDFVDQLLEEGGYDLVFAADWRVDVIRLILADSSTNSLFQTCTCYSTMSPLLAARRSVVVVQGT